MKQRLLLLFLIVLFISCSTEKQFEITDIIQPVKLTAGSQKSIHLSDLFYSPEYQIKFLPNDIIKIEPSDSAVTFSAGNNFEGLTTVDFELYGKLYSIPVYIKIVDEIKFSFRPKKKYNSLTLFGSFNGWNRQTLPLNDPDGDGIFDVCVQLEPGRYEYKFYADGEELLDPQNPNKIPNGIGGINSFIEVKNKFPEKLILHKDIINSSPKENKFTFSLESKTTQFLSKKNVLVFLDNNLLSDEHYVCEENKIKILPGNIDFQNKKMLRVTVTVNGQVSNMQMIPLNDKNFSWYDGIIYSLMVDRFSNGETENDNPIKHDSLEWKANYMGGDLQGITNKINEGYFNKLGINTIWISPVYSNPNEAFREYPEPHRYYSGYHGYWPTHHLMVEEHFGDMDKLKDLVNNAHEHGIKILLDFVSNHVHEQHPFFKNNRDWFGQLELPDGRLNLRFWDEYRLTTWFEPYLPSFDYDNSHEAVEAMTDNAVWWLKTTGADGFRHDAVKHVPNNFWRRLTQKLNEKIAQPENKYVYQIGETFGDYGLVSSYVNPGQLSAQFNFELYNVASAVFLDKERSFAELANEMDKTLEVYGALHFMGNILDSHDKNRFMAYADDDITSNTPDASWLGWNNPPEVNNPYNYKKAEIYYAYMMSIPGLPVIYYGSEFGMTGAADPDNRRMMRFDNDLSEGEKELLNNVKKIVGIRNNHSALREGDFITLKADKNVFAYLRSDFNERILVVINKSNSPVNVDLEFPPQYSISLLASIKTNDTISVKNNSVSIPVKDTGWEMYILK